MTYFGGRPNQAMQLIDSQFPLLTAFAARVHVAPLPAGSIASKPDVDARSVCRRERMPRGMHRGFAAAVDSFIPMNSPYGLPVHVAPLPAGSILLAR